MGSAGSDARPAIPCLDAVAAVAPASGKAALTLEVFTGEKLNVARAFTLRSIAPALDAAPSCISYVNVAADTASISSSAESAST